MELSNRTCHVQQDEDALVVIPQRDIGEFNYEEFEEVAGKVVEMLNNGEAKYVIVDLQHTDYVGSETVGLLVQLSKTTRRNNGRLVICSASKREAEVFKVSNLDRCWSICPSREDAMVLIRQLTTRVGSRVQVVSGSLESVAGEVIAIRGDRLLVALDSGSPGIFVEIHRSVTAIIHGSPETTSAGKTCRD